jgi:hypothetical protein
VDKWKEIYFQNNLSNLKSFNLSKNQIFRLNRHIITNKIIKYDDFYLEVATEKLKTVNLCYGSNRNEHSRTINRK